MGPEFVVVVLNFTPVPRFDYRIGVPKSGEYSEILNSDSQIYGGSNIGNQGKVVTEKVRAHGQPQSVKLSLPPLGMLVLKPSKTKDTAAAMPRAIASSKS